MGDFNAETLLAYAPRVNKIFYHKKESLLDFIYVKLEY